MTRLHSSAGNTVVLGSQLGRGGEGSVYEIAGRPNFVAKIYHQTLDTEKTRKLEGMVRQAHPSLLEISAWPVDILRSAANSPVCGFVMRRLSNHYEIHSLYGPAHRKRTFPHADWSFLIHAARNLSSAFETIHAHGHVIGDVNPGNVVVSAQALIKLIDCDSFQIHTDGQLFSCNVGVPQFTAPELQDRPFNGLQRTPTHDNFGLAVLCFHLLFMGRHPFAGRYQGEGDMPIEQAIKEFRFAFGRFGPIWSMETPPNSLPLEVLPEFVANLFERAFAPPDPNRGRPSARQWFEAMEQLSKELRVCSQFRDHKYPREQPKCPWCILEQESGNKFFVPPPANLEEADSRYRDFNLEEVWKRILAVRSPGNEDVPQPEPSEHVEPTPLSESLEDAQRKNWIKTGSIFGAALLATIIYLPLSWLWLPLALIAWVLMRDNTVRQEYQRRRLVLLTTRREHAELQTAWQYYASDQTFLRKLRELDVLRNRHMSITDELQQALKRLETHRRQNQLRTFLEGQFIDTANITGIRTTDKMALTSYGIETAADITEKALHAVPGFGQHLGGQRATTLLKWRRTLERSFRYDPSQGISPGAIITLQRRNAQQQRPLEQDLLKGAEELNKIKAEILKRRAQLSIALLRQAMQEAQARADLSVFYPNPYMLWRQWRG